MDVTGSALNEGYVPASSVFKFHHDLDVDIHGRALSELQRRLLPPHPLPNPNPAHGPCKSVDPPVDEDLPHSECKRISESRTIGPRGSGVGLPSDLWWVDG